MFPFPFLPYSLQFGFWHEWLNGFTSLLLPSLSTNTIVDFCFLNVLSWFCSFKQKPAKLNKTTNSGSSNILITSFTMLKHSKKQNIYKPLHYIRGYEDRNTGHILFS